MAFTWQVNDHFYAYCTCTPPGITISSLRASKRCMMHEFFKFFYVVVYKKLVMSPTKKEEPPCVFYNKIYCDEISEGGTFGGKSYSHLILP